MSGLETRSSGRGVGIDAQPLILILGAGESASGAAYRLVKAGLRVVMTEQAYPSMARMCVSYGSCVQHRAVIIEGIIARRAKLDDIPRLLSAGVIPVLIDPDATSIGALRPAVVIDTRNAGTSPELKIDAAPLVIGIGTGATVGIHCHAIIGTNRGHSLGHVFWDNNTNNNVAGEDHILRAPTDGTVVQAKVIGCLVKTGMVVARVGGLSVTAPVDGVVRGLVDDDVYVTTGRKIGDVDPYLKREHCFTISDQALAIGGGAVEAVLSATHIRQLFNRPLFNGQLFDNQLSAPAEQATF